MRQTRKVTWRGHAIPVKADFNDKNQAIGFERVLIADMPPAMREAIQHWVTEIRIVKMGMPPTGCAYYLVPCNIIAFVL